MLEIKRSKPQSHQAEKLAKKAGIPADRIKAFTAVQDDLEIGSAFYYTEDKVIYVTAYRVEDNDHSIFDGIIRGLAFAEYRLGAEVIKIISGQLDQSLIADCYNQEENYLWIELSELFKNKKCGR